jgi:hypothetical protein
MNSYFKVQSFLCLVPLALLGCKQAGAQQKNFEAERGLFNKEKSAIRFLPPEISSSDPQQPFLAPVGTGPDVKADFQACAYRTFGSSTDVVGGELLLPRPVFFSEIAKGIAGDPELFRLLAPWENRFNDAGSIYVGAVVAGTVVTFAGVGLCGMLTGGACIPILGAFMKGPVNETGKAVADAGREVAKAASGRGLETFLLGTLLGLTSYLTATTSITEFKNQLSHFQYQAWNNRKAKELMELMAEERQVAKKVTWPQLDGIQGVIKSAKGNVNVQCKAPSDLNKDVVTAYLEAEESVASPEAQRTPE